MDRNSIIKDLLILMQKNEGPSYSWYVGISQDARKRLFSGHNVSETNGIWIWRPADNSAVAREVEDYFVNNLRTDGAPGGGGLFSTQVYAYIKTNYTNP